MRLIDLEVDAPGLLQSSEFAGERLLTGVSLRYRCRPGAAIRRLELHPPQLCAPHRAHCRR